MALLRYLTILLILIITACNSSEKIEANNDSLSVVVTNAPLYYFTQRMAPATIEIIFPMQQSGDPAYWDIQADSIARIQQADLILFNGADYETWAPNVSLPTGKIINTNKNTTQLIAAENAITHSHGDEGEHAHAGTAFTTWLDMAIAAQQAAVIRDALIVLTPDKKELIQQAFEGLSADLKQLDDEFKDALDSSKVYAFSHPVYQYFQQAYNLRGESVHWEPNISVTEEMTHEMEHLKERTAVEFLLWEDTPREETVTYLANMGITSVVVNPGTSWADGYDFVALMKENVKAIRKALSPTP